MNNWQIDLYTGLDKSTNMQDVLDATLKIVKPFGVDYLGWGKELPFPMPAQKMLALNTAEDHALEKTANGGYDEAPVPTYCSRSMAPPSWLGRKTGRLKRYRTPLEEYYSWGRFGGWAQSLVESKPIYSMLWIDTFNPIQKADIDNIYYEMQWISTAVFSHMNQVKTTSNIKLSLREKEILHWTGDGKTADQISQILSLSQSTVNFHLRNVMTKQDAPKRQRPSFAPST